MDSKLHPDANCAYEIVIDGIERSSRRRGDGRRPCAPPPGQGVVAITAGNYGGKLGKFHFHLRKLLNG